MHFFIFCYNILITNYTKIRDSLIMRIVDYSVLIYYRLMLIGNPSYIRNVPLYLVLC